MIQQRTKNIVPPRRFFLGRVRPKLKYAWRYLTDSQWKHGRIRFAWKQFWFAMDDIRLALSSDKTRQRWLNGDLP